MQESKSGAQIYIKLICGSDNFFFVLARTLRIEVLLTVGVAGVTSNHRE